MSERTPAGDKGTADRIAADNGGYWVRLVTKQALRREGVVMRNCLDSQGHGQHTAGNEDMVSDGFWSLRKADGLSHMLVHVHANRIEPFVGNAAGPNNNQPSAWCCRQLRHLVEAFLDAETILRIPDAIALTGEDGRTWRPDKAPQDVKDAAAARRKAEDEAKAKATSAYRESAWCNMELRNGAVVALRGEPSEAEDSFRSLGSRLLVLDEVDTYTPAEDAIRAAMEQGIVTQHVVSPRDGETLSIRMRGRVDEILTPNGDGSYALQLGNYTFPNVRPNSYTIEEFGPDNTLSVQIAPPSRPPARVMRRLDGSVVMVPELWGETRHSPGIITP